MGYRDPEFEVLPAGWSISELQELVENHNPKRQPLNSQERVTRQGVYPYCGANGVVDHINDFKFDGDFVLIAEDGGYWGKHQPSSYIMRGRFWVNNHAHVVRAKDGVTTNEYLSFMLNYLNIDPFIGGDARGKLTKAVLQQIEVPHPDFPEQQRIAQVLSTVQEAIAQQERLIRTTTELKQALMQKLFTEGLRGEALKETEIGRVPESWEVVKLGDLCSLTTGRKDVNEGSPDGPYPFFTCSTEVYRSPVYSFDTEAILVAGNGKVGETKYYSGKFEAYQRTYVLSDFRTHGPFIYQFLKERLSTELNRVVSGSTMPYIRKGDLENVLVPVPSDTEQLQITAQIETVDRKVQIHEQRHAALQDLFRTLLHELMTGKVRVGDKALANA